MFGDHMVLQRDKTNRIWGWAKPGARISVEIAGHSATAQAAADGRWQAELLPPAVGGPYTLRISGPETVVFTNVLVGDVWLGGGQSNMEMGMNQIRNSDAEIKAATYPQLRLFLVEKTPAYAPAITVKGNWKVCTPQTISESGWGGFSAVAYYFGRRVQQETNVPIGLIQDCWGGTPAESWAQAESLRALGGFDEKLKEIDRLHQKGGKAHGSFVTHWYEEFDPGEKEYWFRKDLDDHDWKPVTIPGGFAELGVPTTPAVCYFRKTVVLPNPIPAGKAKIQLGVIEKMDTTQINGRWVGASSWVENPREYTINQDVLKPGTNVIAVRVLKTRADGGFQSKPEQLKLVLGDKTEIPLAGEWKGKLAVDAKPPHPLPLGYENWPTMPAVLYNGMIAPVAPLAIAGALWYQGESNVGRAAEYRKLLPTMIADWRRAFQSGDFPFYIVSLAAFTQPKEVPGDDSWAELRAAQAFVARTVKNSGLALAIDLGDPVDIHPKDKKEVGERLAFCALANHYGKKVVFAGPTFERVESLPGALKLHFKNTDGGLMVKGDKLGEFAVAGDDKKWFWAEAKITGDAVIVSSPQVANPKVASYAWQGYPRATLYNGAGLPAIPFRTDDH
jgi:sialate O-acetylesterase